MPHLPRLAEFAAEVAAAGFRHVVYLGTKANSLVPTVFAHVLASRGDGLPLTVLDTSDPVNLGNFDPRIPLTQTLFLVASKSGTDPHPLAFAEDFYSQVEHDKRERSGKTLRRHFRFRHAIGETGGKHKTSARCSSTSAM